MPGPNPTAAAKAANASANAMGHHPLEVLIPYFRRFRPSTPRNILYTSTWNTLLTVVFTAFGLVFESRASILVMFWNTFVFARVAIEDNPPHGTRVTITLPLDALAPASPVAAPAFGPVGSPG